MQKQPNTAEKSLIAEMEKAVQRLCKHDPRETGGFDRFTDAYTPDNSAYFEHGAERDFQKLALKAADLIETQGSTQTHDTILKVAKAVKSVGDMGWSHANSIGFAFKKALEGSRVSNGAKKRHNPFKGMAL